MERRPAIAVAAPNVLMGVGMKSILEKIIPAADVELFGDFESFTEANPERFFHFFVAAQLFVTHGSFFRARRSPHPAAWAKACSMQRATCWNSSPKTAPCRRRSSKPCAETFHANTNAARSRVFHANRKGRFRLNTVTQLHLMKNPMQKPPPEQVGKPAHP